MMFAVYVVLFGAVSMPVSAATTKYNLLGLNPITVTESQVKCLNGVPASVTTAVTGKLYNKTKTRTDFKGKGWQNRMTTLDRVPDDEQGHVVGSVFGGPIEQWNLVPMHKTVNRKFKASNSILNRWDEFEKWARDELDKSSIVPIEFTIQIRYAADNGCRPVGFNIDAKKQGTPGFKAQFNNGPYGSFAASSQGPSKRRKKN